jgi:hypothetical protein
LNGTETLAAGQTLSIPARVTNVHQSSSTFRVYDPNKAVGDVQPTTPPPPPPPKHHSGCGTILAVIVAIVVVAILHTPIQNFFSGLLGVSNAAAAVDAAAATALTATGTAASAAATAALASATATLSTVGTLATVAAGATLGVIGAVASQGVLIATGNQDKFDWKSVALGAISGGVGAGLGAITSGPLSSASVGGAIGRAVTGNVITQGVALATGLQSKFDWTGVAASAVSAGAGYAASAAVGYNPGLIGNLGNDLKGGLTGAASAIASAATRSLIDGTDFGDNITAALPDVIGQTIGNVISGQIQHEIEKAHVEEERIKQLATSAYTQFNELGDGVSSGIFGEGGNLSLDGVLNDGMYRPGIDDLDLYLTQGTNSFKPLPRSIEVARQGGEFLFIGGAGGQGDYLEGFERAFTNAGFQGVRVVNANEPGDPKLWQLGADVLGVTVINDLEFARSLEDSSAIADAAAQSRALHEQGKQYNLGGYSYGSAAAAASAYAIAQDGGWVDNLILIGAPINQDLYTAVRYNPNIANVITVDLSSYGDPIHPGMSDFDIAKTLPILFDQWQKNAGHFYYSGTGQTADQRRSALARMLYDDGVR